LKTSLLHLLHIADPTLPIGGYTHSAALETYVQHGLVTNADGAKRFAQQMLSRNMQFGDAAFMALAYDAAKAGNLDRVLELDAQCSAVKLPMEMRQASQKLGVRLFKIFEESCSDAVADGYRTQLKAKQTAGNYCIVFGIYAASLDIEKEQALLGFYYNAAVGFVTNAVKLVPLSQQAGQHILFALQPLIGELAANTMQPNEKMLGICCTGFDIRSMQHEQLYSRLYMS
jgi:urease accessory protein